MSKVEDRLDKLSDNFGRVETDIAWLKKAIIGLYGSILVPFLLMAAKAYFGG